MSLVSSFFNAAGDISGILGIISFFQDNLAAPVANGAVVRVKAGLQSYDAENLGGCFAKVQGYNHFNELIGVADKETCISTGDYNDITLQQERNGEQTQYATLIGTNDAICVSWVTLSNKDGAFNGAWTGDIGWSCGHAWNWGNQTAGRINETGEAYYPRCTWIDADHTNGLDVAAMKIDFEAYGATLEDTLNKNQACWKTTFSGGAGEIDGIPGKKKRSMVGKERPAWMHDRLIVSDHYAHNATELCQSSMSYGPDAVGSDGYYCNMETRELFPVCKFHNVEGCVNVDVAGGKVNKRASLGKRSADLNLRAYKRIDQW